MKIGNHESFEQLEGVVRFIRGPQKEFSIKIRPITHSQARLCREASAIDKRGTTQVTKLGDQFSRTDPNCDVYKDRVELCNQLSGLLVAAFCIDNCDNQSVDFGCKKDKLDEYIAKKVKRNASGQKELISLLLGQFGKFITPSELNQLVARCEIINNGVADNADKLLARFFLSGAISDQQQAEKS